MNTPLLTDAEAHARATELVASFNRDPDVLSPDEQALAMELKALSHARRDRILKVLNDNLSPWTFDGSEPMCLALFAAANV